MKESVGRWLRPAVYLGHNGLTLAGAVLTTSSALTLLAFWAFEILRGGPINPYSGIAFYLVLPGVFAFGLFLMPLGVVLRRLKLKRHGDLPVTYPAIDFQVPLLRRAAVLFVVFTCLNVAILGASTYRGVEYMDSAQFCGQTCHSVMAPEYTAYQNSPHARVGCVSCHIGPGAPWFVKAKISGLRQVLAVTTGTFSTPIPSPVHDLRPARDTCETCHWPQRFTGDKFVVRTSHANDETSTPSTTVLVMKIGGKTWKGMTGIHGRHLDDKERISYETTDEKRQVITKVFWRDDSGKTVEYVAKDAKPAAGDKPAHLETRTMDCIDCHNRPTHIFEMPERAVDEAINAGKISKDLPFIRKKSVEALKAESDSRTGAAERIASALNDYYKATYPDLYQSHRPQLDQAISQLQAIYARNVYPNMKITWGTYPTNIGHDPFPGCFRCHDGNHESKDGRVITAECDACHAILAQDETNPKVLADLGLSQ